MARGLIILIFSKINFCLSNFSTVQCFTDFCSLCFLWFFFSEFVKEESDVTEIFVA